MEDKFKKWVEAKLESELPAADAERAMDYADDLLHGLKTIRTYPQGVVIYGSARLKPNDKYAVAARELGGMLARNGHAVITGGGPGIMEAAHHGAFEYGGRTIGLNIELPHEQHINPYVTDQLEFKYFFARKVMLAMSGKVYVFFPGGFGTLDELSEILVLMQEGKMPKMPVFLYGKSYWHGLDKFFRNRLYKDKMIHFNDLAIYKVTNDPKEIVKAANKIGHPKVGDNLYDVMGPGQSNSPLKN